MDAGGGFPEQLTSMPDGAEGAQWSPDGKWISFISPPPGTRAPQVFVVRPDGTEMRRLTADAGERNICGFWTRDSQLSISTMRRTSTAMESALFDPATGNARVIATSPQFGIVVDTSCDGRQALLLRRDGNARGLYVLGIDPPTPQRAIFPPADEETIGGFDCERNAIAGVSNHGRDRLALVRISLGAAFGKMETIWAREDAELGASATSPDGRTIAAVWSKDGADELWVRQPPHPAFGTPLPMVEGLSASPIPLPPGRGWRAAPGEGPGCTRSPRRAARQHHQITPFLPRRQTRSARRFQCANRRTISGSSTS